MARFHDIDTDIWEDLLECSRQQKLLYIYLFSCPSCRPSGLFKISTKTIKHHTDSTEEDLRSLCGGLIEYDFGTQEVWVRGKFKRILSGFKNNERMQIAVKHDFENLESNILKSLFVKKYEGACKGLVSPSLPLPLPLPLVIKGGVGEKECDQLDAFNLILDAFPTRLGESGGRRIFFQWQVTSGMLARMHTAVKNYKKHLENNEWRTPMNFEKFLLQWTDWENHVEVETEDQKTARLKARLKRED